MISEENVEKQLWVMRGLFIEEILAWQVHRGTDAYSEFEVRKCQVAMRQVEQDILDFRKNGIKR